MVQSSEIYNYYMSRDTIPSLLRLQGEGEVIKREGQVSSKEEQ